MGSPSPHPSARRLTAVLLLLLLVVGVLTPAAASTTVQGSADAASSARDSSGADDASAPPHVQHHCIHDQLARRVRTQRVAQATPATPAAVQAAPRPLRALSDTTYERLRIRVFTPDLDSTAYYCNRKGAVRLDYNGLWATCAADDVLTNANKSLLTDTLIPQAVQMHEDRLTVEPLSSIVVNASMKTTEYCKQFHVPESHYTTGVSDADFLLYVSAKPPLEYDMFALTCQTSDTGRPLVGVLNIHPHYIFNSSALVRRIAHELLHALGFNLDVFSSQGMYSTIANVRGKWDVPAITSSATVAHAASQYGCSDLTFMELEVDDEYTFTPRSHWKMRNAKDELMAHNYYGAQLYTAITIGAMEDTGFYKGNYDNAEVMAWGLDAGCTLIDSKCGIDGVSQVPSMFCMADDNGLTCTSDRLAQGSCIIDFYNTDLPSYFQYFTTANEAGDRSAMDYCPYITQYTNTYCASGDLAVVPGSVISASSRCFDASSTYGLSASGYLVSAVCADVKCNETTQTYQVRVHGAKNFVDCPIDRTITPSDSSSTFGSGTIACPAYIEVCVGNNADLYGSDGAAGRVRPAVAALVVALLLLLRL